MQNMDCYYFEVSLNWNLSIREDWPMSCRNPPVSASPGLRHMLHSTRHFYVTSGDQPQVPVLAKQAFC